MDLQFIIFVTLLTACYGQGPFSFNSRIFRGGRNVQRSNFMPEYRTVVPQRRNSRMLGQRFDTSNTFGDFSGFDNVQIRQMPRRRQILGNQQQFGDTGNIGMIRTFRQRAQVNPVRTIDQSQSTGRRVGDRRQSLFRRLVDLVGDGQGGIREGYEGAKGGENGFPVHGGYCAGEMCADGGLAAGVGNGIGTGTLEAFNERLRTGRNENLQLYERFAGGPASTRRN